MKRNNSMRRLCKGTALTLTLLMAACGGETERRVDSAEPAATEDPAATGQDTSQQDEWDYENTNWETISDSECRSNVQSPINIDTQKAIEADLADFHTIILRSA